MRRFTLLTIALACTVTFLLGVIIAGGLTPAAVVSSAPERPPAAWELARPRRAAVLPGAVSFADVAERINPAVVNIEATSKPRATFARAAESPSRRAAASSTGPGRAPAAASSSTATATS
jgi:hypothetical protein